MKQERLEILNETVENLNRFFQFQTTYDVTVDEMGLVMRGTNSPEFLSQRLEDLVKEHGFSYVKGETAEVLQKDVMMVGSVVLTRRFDRENVLTLGVTV